jgi:hypothetical protein
MDVTQLQQVHGKPATTVPPPVIHKGVFPLGSGDHLSYDLRATDAIDRANFRRDIYGISDSTFGV